MIKNYLKIALRNLLRQRFYSAINLLGLAVGIACAVLLYMYIQHELSYDAHFKNSKKIYRVELEGREQGEKWERSISTQWLLAPTIRKDYPEVAQVTKTMIWADKMFQHQNKQLLVKGLRLADEDYFKVFSHRFLQGDPRTALQKPHSIVLTKSLAAKVFGRANNVLNTTLQIDKTSYLITGVIEDIPDNTHFQTEGFVSMGSLSKRRLQSLNIKSWASTNFMTYVLLKQATSSQELENKLAKLTEAYIAPVAKKYGEEAKIKVTPLRDIRLYSADLADEGSAGTITYIYLFTAITFLILLIAGINYMNLATARSLNRAKEVGVRKVVGSYRSQLIFQFLVESFLLVLLASVLGLVLAEVAMPFFNNLSGKSLSVRQLFSVKDVIYGLLILLSIGLLSGSYPAFVLSSFKPSLVLKGKFGSNKKGSRLRKGLVVVQFSISIVLIVTTWFVYQQINFMLSKDTGYTKEQVVVMQLNDPKRQGKLQVVKNKLAQNPGIKSISSANFIPVIAGHWANNSYAFEVNGETRKTSALYAPVDENYLKTMGMQLLEGKNFTQKSDQAKGVIVNETLVKKLGLKVNSKDPKLNPIGKKVSTSTSENGNPIFNRKIIGVVKDFHSKSFHSAIEPMVLSHVSQGWAVIARLNAGNIRQTMQAIQKTWEGVDQSRPFEARFVSDAFNRQYESEERLSKIFMAFAVLTIFIACLGLFGLISFVVRQRNKEIGIRKVLGASVQNILQLISMDFVKLVLLANLLAFPLAYYAVQQWLQNFAYQTSINLLIFVASGILALTIALLTISTQALRATRVNPAVVLKDE
ncbi:MAG TPA: ABC transporter permease [Microscillaceae bacterium]|nr:ABC transporter permease [Microscillaceae bacterium]